MSLVCYRLKVTLVGSNPPVWRIAQVDGKLSLGGLHDFLSEELGWKGDFQHKFLVKGEEFIDPEFTDETRKQWDEGIAIAALGLKEGEQFEYFFGESRHEIVVEKIFELEQANAYEKILEGAGTCCSTSAGAGPVASSQR